MFERLKELVKIHRNFQDVEILEQKIKKLNEFFVQEKLDSCVIGLSGGIDSALVCLLLLESQKQKNSPIKKIVGINAPILISTGVTNQQQTIDDSLLLKNSLLANKNNEFLSIDLSEVSKIYNSVLKSENDWTRGQIDYLLRSPLFYGQTNVLNSNRFNSIVIGTTNKSEEYLGFCGKSSDLMVDLQPIVDLHKSEVYKLAKLLNCPYKIIEKIPSGDIFNYLSDEQLIGAPYDFIELYELCNLYFNIDELFELYSFSQEEIDYWNFYSLKIKAHRNKNSHKFKVGRIYHTINIFK